MQTSPLPISCYIRTKNEASRIEATVCAAMKLCDEVIVIDSESTDDTREIANTAGAKVILQPWLGEGFQKRIAEDAAKNDWVLDVDADEVISEELAKAITELFKLGADPCVIYAIKVATVDPTGCLWKYGAADYRDKLYHKKHFRCPASEVWSNLEVPKGAKIIKLGGHLEHYSFPNISFLMSKLNRASTMRAEEKKLKPYPIIVLRILFLFPFYLARNLFRRGMWRYGIYSWAVASVVAFSRWLTDVKMLERHLNIKP